MNNESDMPVLAMLSKPQEGSESGETWALALCYERAQRDRMADINYAKQEGEERGIARCKAETLQRLLARGFSEAQARDILGDLTPPAK